MKQGTVLILFRYIVKASGIGWARFEDPAGHAFAGSGGSHWIRPLGDVVNSPISPGPANRPLPTMR